MTNPTGYKNNGRLLDILAHVGNVADSLKLLAERSEDPGTLDELVKVAAELRQIRANALAVRWSLEGESDYMIEKKLARDE